LAWRATDGSSRVVSYTPGTQPGQWQPTPPTFSPAAFPQWSAVTPFAISSGSQFRPAGPPALTSQAYANALQEVEALGSANSTTRTPEQSQIALFWADGAGTETPPGHWNEIAEQVARTHGDTLVQDARLFATLNIALADAAIAAWDAKYTFNFWRPVTAIHNANLDGNARTTADPSWTPFLVTPAFPSYVSGHSSFSAAAAVVLTSFFGGHVTFTARSDALPGVTRTFHSFMDAAEEAGLSRIYGGIHYSFDNRDGLAMGGALADYVIHHVLLPFDQNQSNDSKLSGSHLKAPLGNEGFGFEDGLLTAITRVLLPEEHLVQPSHHMPDPGRGPSDRIVESLFFKDLAQVFSKGWRNDRSPNSDTHDTNVQSSLINWLQADAVAFAFVEDLRPGNY
jgi:membrane-associated phospholipid phosphatase